MTVSLQDKFDQINDHARPILYELLREWFPHGRMISKTEYGVGNLNGDPGESLSINIHTSRWKDFAGGPGGHDPLSIYAHACCNGDRNQAFKELRAKFGLSDDAPAPRRKARDHLRVVEDWKPMVPPPAGAMLPQGERRNWDHVFEYRDRSGNLLRYVVRRDAKGTKKKEVWPFTYGIKDGKPDWHMKHPAAPRSLYGLERLDGSPVLLLEGEKKCDQMRALLSGYACLSLTAGTGNVNHNDLSPLAGLAVVYCPDNDEPGRKASQAVASELADYGCTVLVLDVFSHGFPEGWDLGNAYEDGWDAARIEAFIRDNAKPLAAAEAKKKKRERMAETLDGFALNEDGIALAFAERFRDRLRYCHTTGAWFVWTGSRWQKEETKLAFCWARDVCRELNNEGENAIAKAATAGAVERFAQADRAFAVTGAVWDRDSFLLGTPGGTVDLTTGLMREGCQDDFMTKQTAVAPTDPLHGEGCPLWLAFLDQATKGDKELIRFMRQIAGYALTGDTREHALFFIYGPGGNGKGVFLNTITKIIGDYGTAAAMDTFTASQSDKHPTDLAKLKGARLVTASETEEGRAWAESRIKQMTGGDRISARFMRQDFFEFDPTFKLLIVGNHKPILRNVDEAARRRFNIIPFIHKPEKKDLLLEAKLKEEWPAILRWMIDGCLDWQRNGLIRPASVGRATAEYFNSQDLFGQWLEECCELHPGNDMRLETAADLFASWKEFAESNGEQPGSGKAFGDKLSQRDVGSKRGRHPSVKGKTVVMRFGISLIRPAPEWARDD